MKLDQNINSSKLSSYIADCMENKKAEDIRIIDLKKIKNSVTDYFVLATGNSNIHIDSIADGIESCTKRCDNVKNYTNCIPLFR